MNKILGFKNSKEIPSIHVLKMYIAYLTLLTGREELTRQWKADMCLLLF